MQSLLKSPHVSRVATVTKSFFLFICSQPSSTASPLFVKIEIVTSYSVMVHVMTMALMSNGLNHILHFKIFVGILTTIFVNLCVCVYVINCSVTVICFD